MCSRILEVFPSTSIEEVDVLNLAWSAGVPPSLGSSCGVEVVVSTAESPVTPLRQSCQDLMAMASRRINLASTCTHTQREREEGEVRKGERERGERIKFLNVILTGLDIHISHSPDEIETSKYLRTLTHNYYSTKICMPSLPTLKNLSVQLTRPNEPVTNPDKPVCPPQQSCHQPHKPVCPAQPPTGSGLSKTSG